MTGWHWRRTPDISAPAAPPLSRSENRQLLVRPCGKLRAMNLLDPDTCYRALQSRDARFDGRFFIGVTSTGIYCRPICPARTARFENCRFFPSAAAAQDAGFRPCLRCRPETAPARGAWLGSFNTVSRALALIADGALDAENGAEENSADKCSAGDQNAGHQNTGRQNTDTPAMRTRASGDAGVVALAERLGVGERQLRRLFQQHLGASPLAVAQTRRVLLAKQLIQETDLPMAQVALASGFGSVRRFNETFADLYGKPPRELRKATAKTSVQKHSATHEQAASGNPQAADVEVRLRYQPPYDWPLLLDFFRQRAIAGVEEVGADYYRRSFGHAADCGSVEVRQDAARNSLRVRVQLSDVRALPNILMRVRRVFDVDADLDTINTHLCRDPQLAALIAQRPGLRAPGAWDGFELAVRAVLGQQVTIVAARKLAAQLVQLCAQRVQGCGDRLTHAFPDPHALLAADLSTLGMPGARRNALKALAEAALADRDLFRASASIDDTVKRLCAIRGIGEWTAHYIALRAVRETDAFPASDVGLLRAMARDGERPTPPQLIARAEIWRPWRAYAAQHLWAADPGLPASGAATEQHPAGQKKAALTRKAAKPRSS